MAFHVQGFRKSFNYEQHKYVKYKVETIFVTYEKIFN